MTGSFKLAAYLKRHKLTQLAFAEKAGVPVPQVSLYLSAIRRPGLESALKIERATDGAVRAEDWVELTGT
jgi:transcriptional regulator with XRE-family HTH domain